MPLNKADHIIKKLAVADNFFSDPTISCWEKKQGNISIYLFAIIFLSADQLLTGYKQIRDHVAISFQSQELDSSAERWNLYLFYIVAEKISHVQKQVIEHDKFSTRKIVCSGIEGDITDEVISGLIEAELFDFKVEKRKPASTNLEALLSKDFPNVASALKALGGADTVDALQPLLKHLSHE
jgi:hypothetical protein